MAGNRRAVMGHLIASRDLDKVFLADDATVIGIARVAGLASNWSSAIRSSSCSSRSPRAPVAQPNA